MFYFFFNKIKYHLLLFVIFLVGFISILELEQSIFLSFILFGIVGLAIAKTLCKYAENIFIIIYSYTVLFIVLFFFIFKLEHGVPYEGGGSDSKSYEIGAELLTNSNFFKYDVEKIGEIIEMPYHNSPGYIYVVFLLAKMSNIYGEFHTMVPRLFNAFILALSLPYLFYIGKELKLDIIASLNSAIICGIFPITTLIASQTYRDIIVMAIFIFSVYFAMKFYTSAFVKKIHIYLIFFFLSVLILQFRFLNVLNVLSTIFTASLLSLFSIKIISVRKAFLFISLLIISIIVFNENLFIENLINTLDVYNQATSQGLDRSTENGLSLILFNLPPIVKQISVFFYATITPLPIFYTKFVEFNFLSIGTIIQFCYLPFLVIGFFNKLKNPIAAPMNILFIITLVGYVYGSFSFRHIVYLVPFAVVYISVGLNIRPNSNNLVIKVQFLVITLLIFLYYFIKYIV